MQADKLKKSKVPSELERFMAAGDNTHNKFTSVTAVSAINILSRNHKTSPHAHNEITSELIKQGILPKNQDKARDFRNLLDDIANRNQDQWDLVKCYNHETGEEKEEKIRMNDVLRYLIAAIQDQSKFTQSTYKDRLKKFHGLIEWFREGECNTGRRHDLIIEMLHNDYEGLFVVTECKSSIEAMLSRFYEKKLIQILESNPQKAYRLLCEWIDGSCAVRPVLKETPLHNALFEDETELRNHLVQYFKESGFFIDFEGYAKFSELKSGDRVVETPEIQLARYIVENIQSRAYISHACPEEYKNEIGLLAELWEQQNKFPEYIKLLFEGCEQLEDLRLCGLDGYVLCQRLRTKSLSFQRLLPLAEEEGELVKCAREIYHTSCRYLENPQNWLSLREELEALDKRLSDAIDLAAKQPHSDLIRDSLSMLSGERNKIQFTVIHQKITDCFTKNSLAIKDNEAIKRLVDQHVETQGDSHVVTLTPYTLNRICWHALTTSPAKWSENFIRLLEMVVLPLIKLAKNDEDESIDKYNKMFIKHSYPDDLEGQINWLLMLAKNPKMIIEHIPPLFAPCYLADYQIRGFDLLDNIDGMNKLGTAIVTKRGGRWPAWMGAVDIDDLKFSDDDEESIKYFVLMLLQCPQTDVRKIIDKGMRLLVNVNQLFSVLNVVMDMPNRHYVLDKNWEMIDSVQALAAVLPFFPATDRSALIKRSSDLVEKAIWLAHFFRLIPIADRLALATYFDDLYNCFESLMTVADALPLADGFSLIKAHRDLINSATHLIKVAEKYSEHPECQELILSKVSLLRYEEDIAQFLMAFPAAMRLSLAEKTFVSNGIKKFGLKLLNVFDEAERIVLIEKYEVAIVNFYELMKLFDLIPTAVEKFSTLAEKHLAIIKFAINLGKLLPRIPQEKRAPLVDQFYQMTDTAEGFEHVLRELLEDERVNYVDKYLHFLKNSSQIYTILDDAGIPLHARRAIVDKTWVLIEQDGAKYLPLIITTLPEHEAEDMLERHLALIKYRTNLAVAIRNLSPPRRRYWVERGWHLVVNALQLAHVLSEFSGTDRDELLEKGWHLIKDGGELAEVALRYPKEERQPLIDRGWGLVKDSKQFSLVILAADESQHPSLFVKGKHFLQNDNDLIVFIKLIFIFQTHTHSLKSIIGECINYLPNCTNPMNVVKSIFRAAANCDSIRQTIRKSDANNNPVTVEEAEGSYELLQPCLAIIKSYDQMIDLLSDVHEKYQLWIVKHFWYLVECAQQSTKVVEVLARNKRFMIMAQGGQLTDQLIVRDAKDGSETILVISRDNLIETMTSLQEAQQTSRLNRDSPLNTRRSVENSNQVAETADLVGEEQKPANAPTK